MLVFSSLDSRTIWEVLFFNTILDKPSLDRWLISETNPGCWNIQDARDWAPVCPLRFSPFSFITDPTTTTTKNIQAARYWTKINWQPPMSTHIFTVSVQKLVHPKKIGHTNFPCPLFTPIFTRSLSAQKKIWKSCSSALKEKIVAAVRIQILLLSLCLPSLASEMWNFETV